MERIFISYKRKDMEKVFSIVKRIEAELGIKCWVDLDGIESSEQFVTKICKAIDQSEVVLFMHSAAHQNIDFDNDWTVRELNYAEQKKKRVVLVKLDNTPLDNVFLMNYGSRNNIDSQQPVQMQKLTSDLRRWLKLPVKLEPKPIIKPKPTPKFEPKPTPTPIITPKPAPSPAQKTTPKHEPKILFSDQELLDFYRKTGKTKEAEELERRIKKEKLGKWGDIVDFFFDFSKTPFSHHFVAFITLIVLFVFMLFNGYYTHNPSDPADLLMGFIFSFIGIRLLVFWEAIEEITGILYGRNTFIGKIWDIILVPIAIVFYPLLGTMLGGFVGLILDWGFHFVNLHGTFLAYTYIPIAVFTIYSTIMTFIHHAPDK